MSTLTPMMKQFQQIKKEYQDTILFFRLGDFYEMFFDDALVASRVLNITLTARDAGRGKKVPMCGVPHHSANSYIAKLINSGYKVAICEQMEDPKASKGPVKREVVRIITPGTVLDDSILEDKRNNYLLTIYQKGLDFGISTIEISTGEFNVCQVKGIENVKNEIARMAPVECLVPENLVENIRQWIEHNTISFSEIDKKYFEDENKIIQEQFNVYSIDALGLNNYPLMAKAAAATVKYMRNVLKSNLKNVTRINIYDPHGFMLLDEATTNNLELVKRNKKQSLLGVLDYTVTAMGGRLLKNWLVQPLIDLKSINKRLDAVDELFSEGTKRNELRDIIKTCYDFERLLSKVAYGSANARDLLALKKSLKILPSIKNILNKCESTLLKELLHNIDPLHDLVELLEDAIHEEPPSNIKEGRIIKKGYNKEVDELREAKVNGKRWIAELEKKEKDRTGIKSLKVGFNKVFGYYIEVTKPNLHLIPDEYIRKQTLVNTERFITTQLKEYENTILGAEEKLNSLEYELFVEIREKVAKTIPRIQKSARAIACLDALLSLSQAAYLNNYVKPKVTSEDKIEIIQARHPIVEKNAEEQFVPNDVMLDNHKNRTLVITGPNMAGKSTYLRQTALTIIMAQIGSFVPAERAKIGIVDRVFTRIGASDNLAAGESTFMVEMNEVANIINNATHKSLVILDEVGRGTSTYDGLSLAWAITEYIHKNIKCKCLFATHYHELTDLESHYEGIKNYNIAVKEKGENIIFLRQIIPGGADKSYGIYVAKLAGLPSEIIIRAQEILDDLGSESLKVNTCSDNNVLSYCSTASDHNEKEKKVIEKIKELDLLTTSPLEAINILYGLQKELREEK